MPESTLVCNVFPAEDKMQSCISQPHPSERSEVPPTGCRALAPIQQEDLSEAEQEEHGTQHHHTLFQLHVHASRPAPVVVCVSTAAIAPPSPLMHGPSNSWYPASPVGGGLMKGGCVSPELQPGLTCREGGTGKEC